MSRLPALLFFCVVACLASFTVPAVSAQPSLPAAVQLDHLTRIFEQRQLRVCVWPDYYSISYRDPRTYELVGIDVDLARQLARDLGVEAVFVDSSFASLAEDLLADRCDISMFGVGITPQREKLVRFTSPHLFSDMIAVATKSNRKVHRWEDIDQPGVVVSVARGTFHEPVMRERLKHAELIVGDSAHARDQHVEAGRADVFMTDFPYTRRVLETTDWARLLTPDSAYYLTYYAWAMAPGDDRWFDRVQQFLKTIKSDGRLLEAAKKYGLDPIVVND